MTPCGDPHGDLALIGRWMRAVGICAVAVFLASCGGGGNKSAALPTPGASPIGDVARATATPPGGAESPGEYTPVQSDHSTAPGATAATGNGAAVTPVPSAQTQPASGSTRSVKLEGLAALEVGGPRSASVRLTGLSTSFAAFNFDIVYDQTLMTLAAPIANTDALNTSDRAFQCNMPPASGDVDPDPAIGRARLVCFSFGGPQASAPMSPLTIATVQVTGVTRGTATLTFENVAFFAPDGKKLDVGSQPATVEVR